LAAAIVFGLNGASEAAREKKDKFGEYEKSKIMASHCLAKVSATSSSAKRKREKMLYRKKLETLCQIV
jgi:hypothetical protein